MVLDRGFSSRSPYGFLQRHQPCPVARHKAQLHDHRVWVSKADLFGGWTTLKPPDFSADVGLSIDCQPPPIAVSAKVEASPGVSARAGRLQRSSSVNVLLEIEDVWVQKREQRKSENIPESRPSSGP
jgi:hypothetical protein